MDIAIWDNFKNSIERTALDAAGGFKVGNLLQKMSRLESKNERKQFKIEERALKDIFNEWQPIGFTTPDDEYDCLVHNLLSVLHVGSEKRDIAARIEKEIEHHFGLGSVQEKEIESVTNKIWEWWKSRI